MKNRSLALIVVLGFFTFGIYTTYWLISTRNEMVRRGAQIPGMLLLVLPFIILLGVALLQAAVLLISASTNGGEIISGAAFPHILEIITIIIGMLAVLAIFPLTLYWIYKYCMAAERITGGRINSGFAFAMAIILSIVGVGFVWPAILQNDFNRMTDIPPSGPIPQSYPQQPQQPYPPQAPPSI